MQKKIAIIISPNWRDYAEKYLAECLDSVAKQNWTGESKIFLIDNESVEESFNYLKQFIETRLIASLPYEIIRNINNDGFAKGNNEAMKAAIEQGFEYLILFNMDTVVDSNAVTELIRVAEADENIGAVQAKLMLWPDKEKINSLGNATHFLGFGFSEGNGESITNHQPARIATKNVADRLPITNNKIFYPSGAAVLYKAEVLKEVGLFDEEFWMYAEDQDLGWRIWLAGYKCVLAFNAVVYHKYEFSRSISKYYWMDRNRLIIILKNYKLATLILILPALIVMEFGLLIFAIKGSWLKEKIDVYKYFFSLKHWRYIKKARQTSQKLRRIKDRELVPMISSKIAYQEINSPALRFANLIFTVYWKVINKLIIW